jgi:ubiquinol-cytochrome c reductase cytochrome c subunit
MGPAVLTIAATAAILSVAGAHVRAQTPTPLPSPAETVPPGNAQGRLLYLRDCAWCHGAGGEGTVYGPSLEGVGAASADFMLSTGRMPIPEVQEQPEREEPAYTREQIARLVDHVASFGPGPPIPFPDPVAGELGEGAELYQINCAACHSSTGIGGALTSGLIAPDVLRASPVQIAEAIRLGGAGLRTGNMPKFDPEVLSDEQLNSVVKYVLYLQDPDNRGGAELGRIGPVIEGLVAWVAGLFPLVLFIVWIGKRTASKKKQAEG